MSAARELDEASLQQLAARAAALAGFARESIDAPALHAAAARAAEPSRFEAVLDALAVRETSFFRQPDHFRFVCDHFARGGGAVRAWSAGCATGEEAYSLAAALVAAGRDPDVLGTDLIEARLAVARAAIYGAWSVRAPEPDGLHALETIGADRFRVLPRLRAHVRFAAHNLLNAPPKDRFDVVLCRNVLAYLSSEAARRALENLSAAVAPGGLLIFAPLDLDRAPRGFARIGPAELQVFHRERAP